MSNETKFTKKNLVIIEDEFFLRINAEDGEEVATCNFMPHAHLIKTAPKLYAMLDSLVNSKEHDVLFEMQTEIEGLLAEARGEHE